VTARHVAGLRAAAFLTAGIARVPFWTFLLTDGLTAMLGVPFSFALAYFFTDHVKAIFANVHRIERWIGLLVILAVAIAVFVTVRKRDRHVVEEVDGLTGRSLRRLIRPSRHASSRR
jgi:membrane protein DedA with SNARE-associated domain